MSILGSGCATTTTSLKFTESELEVVPAVVLPKLLSSNATNEVVEVSAKSIDEPAVVKRIEGQKYVVVTDTRGKELRLSISQITEIERIRQIKSSETSTTKGGGNAADTVGETLIYGPLVPVSIALWPALRLSGLDAKKNAEDNQKARLVYEDMSKEDLKRFVGEPKEKYYCESQGKSKAHEVWVFEHEKILRGGRALFIDLTTDKVYHNSYNTSFFKNACSLITE